MRAKIHNEKKRKWHARKRRVRKGVDRTGRPWLTVYRSSKHIYAQLIDPGTGNTITTVSTRKSGVLDGSATGGNVEGAKCVGTAIAKAAKERDIKQVVFNRNGFLYHGRVKALAEAAREAGLDF